MPYGASTDPFVLKEGILYIGTVTNPENIGQNNTDPFQFFSGDRLGYIRQGSSVVGLTRQFANARGGTPSVNLRKDLIQKDFMIQAQVFQYNADLMALVLGLDVQPGYSITVPGVATMDLAHIGHDEAASASNRHAIFFDGFLTDNKPFRILMYSGQNTAEDLSLNFSGTDYTSPNLQFEAFPHPDISNPSRDYGVMWIDQT